MKRLLLSLVCCSPLLFSPSVSLSLDLTGPSSDSFLSFEQYGPVSPTETLWAISAKLRPNSSVSVQQTMVAIYKSNPYAFFKGDINKIIPESIIQVPSLAFVEQQTDKEAMDLIRKYSRKKKSVAKKSPTKPLQKVVAKVVESKAIEKIDPAIVAENEVNKAKLISAENNLIELQQEMQLLNEQFIVATEATQALKLKLQPLSDEIGLLTDQLAAEAEIQIKLKQIIDDYRAQLDAVELPPFSGGGGINEMLRLITSSLTNLLIVIISPILLLLLIFVVIARFRSKRELAEQEQELAESTAILMEQSGQFDELLTEDLSDDGEQNLDFSGTESELESVDIDELEIPEEIDLTGSDTLGVTDISEDMIDLTEDTIDLTDDNDVITSEDDPFGIGALTDDEGLISSVDLDEEEVDLSADDPFGISALTEDEELISSVNLDDDDQTEDDPFDIGSLTDDAALDSSVDLDEGKPISDAEQADLDLAAEWEAQVSVEATEEPVKSNDTVEQSEDPTVSSDVVDTELVIPDEQPEFDALDENKGPDALEIADDSAELDLSELETLSTTDEELPSLDIDALETADNSAEFDLSELETLSTTDEVLSSLDIGALEKADDSAELDLSELETLSTTDEELPSLDIDALETLNDNSKQDLLAKQLSDVAFNEEVPLPKIDSATKNDFIDIETLLENSDVNDKDEPYSELALDLGLDEFPDVVDLQESVDIDDDENGIGAQLDLARAYLEIDDKAGAKEILMSVVDGSNGKQRVEIDSLLSRLE